MSDDLANLLKKRVVWWESSIRHNREYDVTDCDLDEKLIERLEADAKLIQEMREALERIAFEGVEDRDKLTRSALDYIGTGGMYPNDKTIAAVALSKAKSQQEGETE